jgi:carboxyl-terminal processing protease
MLPDDEAAEPSTAGEPGPADAAEPVDATEPTGPAAASAKPRRRGVVLPVAAVLVALLAGGALFLSGYTLGLRTSTEPGTAVTDENLFAPFWDTYHTVVDRYAGGPFDREVLVQGAIRGMIDALGDPYSSYLTSDEYRASLQGISGQFEGIGAEIATQAADGTQGCATLSPTCRLLVVAPVAGSPADKAGLKAGDLILATDGAPLDGLNVDSARDKIRGPKGSVVTLTVQRGTASPFDLTITRDIVQEQEVVSRDLADGTVGYVRVNGFSDTAATAAHDAIAAHVAAGRKSIVLDLRGDPGGYVTAARSIASEFIATGPIFLEEDAKGVQIATDAIPGGVAIDPAIRVVVLIDGGSASASEIVAGALQDTGRAMLIGQKSFGKGTVQQWQELTGEGGAFKLTVAKWLTPKGRWIHGVGLTPDVVVTLPDPVPAGTDPTLDKALEVLGKSGAAKLDPAA